MKCRTDVLVQHCPGELLLRKQLTCCWSHAASSSLMQPWTVMGTDRAEAGTAPPPLPLEAPSLFPCACVAKCHWRLYLCAPSASPCPLACDAESPLSLSSSISVDSGAPVRDARGYTRPGSAPCPLPDAGLLLLLLAPLPALVPAALVLVRERALLLALVFMVVPVLELGAGVHVLGKKLPGVPSACLS